ncbi:MAG: hypothetical protein OHK93_006470 [Ramalina farinacea]|uniref:DUF7918 domain-containing protein n=1 Tax=Ramalina farinacea TaxID=258253 RepID=A0AA43TQ45_9LECA|nr:hypothetical protein [Ramalina farinacea]
MVKFKGIHVTVQVAGVDLKEYEDEDEGSYNPGKVSRYVEAVSGAAFAVRIRVPKNYRMNSNALSFYISADGMKGHHPLMDRANPNFAGQQGWVSLTTGVKSFVHGRWEEREWHFSDIHLSRLGEEPTLGNSQHATPAEITTLGSITVNVHRLNVLGQKLAVETAVKTNPDKALELTEKKLKGATLTHSTTMGQAKILGPQWQSDIQYLDGSNFPRATFQFKYRSRSMESLNLEDSIMANRLKARYRQEQRLTVKPERRAIKREREQDDDADDEDDDVTVVDTRAKRAKAHPSADTEVVDLTG